MKLRFGKWDIVVIAAVVALALLVAAAFLPGEQAAQAEIYHNGKLLKTLDLSSDQVFSVTGSCTNTITVQDGRIAVTASNCPGGDCLACGWIDTAGRSIVCLPNGLEIRVVGKAGDVDITVG